MWEKVFPDPTNSPAYYTRILTIDLDGEDAEDCNWVRGFSRVEELSLSATDTFSTSFIPFYHLSCSLVSLHVSSDVIHPQVFGLIHSLPLLQDLTLTGYDIADLDDRFDGPQNTVLPLTSPPLTGSLRVFMEEEITSAARRLLDLPNGLHFREIRLSTYKEEDVYSIAELVATCSETLECLYITFGVDSEIDSSYLPQSLELPFTVGFISNPSIDLSKATNLKEVAFRCHSLRAGWITSTLETITPKHQNLQLISIRIPRVLRSVASATEAQEIEANPSMRLLDLDRLLVQFWDSRSIRARILYPPSLEGCRFFAESAGRWIPYLFPELTRRGIVDIVEDVDGFL